MNPKPHMAMSRRALMLVLTGGTLAACSRAILNTEVGADMDEGGFGNPTAHNVLVMTGQMPFAVNLAQRFAREVPSTVNFAFDSAHLDAEAQALFDPGLAPLRLANPISAETAVMRTSLWPGLVRACRYNLNRQQGRILFFEIGSKYISQHNVIKEEKYISCNWTRTIQSESWSLKLRLI